MKYIAALITLVIISTTAFSQTDCSVDGTYAEGQTWYINSEKVQFQKHDYVKYGLPRVLEPNDVSKAGMFRNVGVYTQTGATGRIEVIYIPTRKGCEFQPYQVYCGQATIEPGVTKGTTMEIKVTTKDIKGAMTYLWSSSDVKILKGQGKRKITVDIKKFKKDDSFEISVVINKTKSCPLKVLNTIVVGK